MSKKRIVLVEIGGSHDECLLTQLSALKKADYDILLVVNKEIEERNPVFKEYASATHIYNGHDSKPKNRRELNKVWRMIRAFLPEKVILNTAQGNEIRHLSTRAWFSKIEFIGIIHTTRKFDGSFTQKWINLQVKKYLLLSEFLLNKIKVPRGVKADYFYPIKFPSEVERKLSLKKSICIIGGVEERRKDLKGFLQMASNLKDKEIRFVFLGKSDTSKSDVRSFMKHLEENSLMNQVKVYKDFVSQDEFNKQLNEAMLILPLVHPNTPSADQYFRNQISGAMSVSFGYKIPMLLHDAYEHIEEMKVASFYYNESNFDKVLECAIQENKAKRSEMGNHEPYQVQTQEMRYIEFIES